MGGRDISSKKMGGGGDCEGGAAIQMCLIFMWSRPAPHFRRYMPRGRGSSISTRPIGRVHHEFAHCRFAGDSLHKTGRQQGAVLPFRTCDCRSGAKNSAERTYRGDCETVAGQPWLSRSSDAECTELVCGLSLAAACSNASSSRSRSGHRSQGDFHKGNPDQLCE